MHYSYPCAVHYADQRCVTISRTTLSTHVPSVKLFIKCFLIIKSNKIFSAVLFAASVTCNADFSF